MGIMNISVPKSGEDIVLINLPRLPLGLSWVGLWLVVSIASINGRMVRRQVASEQGTSNNCPSNWTPSPCICKDVPGTSDKASISCNDAKTGDEIKEAFGRLGENATFETFWIKGTQVTTFPSNMFGKASFANIFCSQNQLSTVDEEAFQGSEDTAENFLFDGNRFTTFNFKSISKMNNLHNFELSSDGLTAVPEDAFGEKPLLEVINLNDNQITTVGQNAFAKLQNLRTIDLSRNNLTSLADNSFSTPQTTNPISLLLGHNDISSVSKDAFKDLKVRAFELEENQLTVLDQDAFSSVVDSVANNRGQISTLGNPFNCDHDAVKWILDLPQQKRFNIIGFMCRDGRALQQLTTPQA